MSDLDRGSLPSLFAAIVEDKHVGSPNYVGGIGDTAREAEHNAHDAVQSGDRLIGVVEYRTAPPPPLVLQPTRPWDAPEAAA